MKITHKKTLSKKSLGTIAVLFLLVLLLTSVFYEWQLNASSESNQRSASLFEQSLLASITKHDYIPSLLVQDEEVNKLLLTPEFNHVSISLKLEFIAEKSGLDDLYVLDKDGDVVATSNFKTKSSFYGKNYAFRPYFEQAKATEQKQYYFAKGVTTGVRGFFISEPIIIDKQFLGSVVAKIVLDEWEQKWNSSNENILVADDQGVVILSAKPQWQYRSIGELPDEVQQKIKKYNQFPNELHNPLFSEELSAGLNGTKQKVWNIDGESYVVNHFPINTVDWTLYHLDDKRPILLRSLWFFLFSSGLAGILSLFWNERRRRMQLIKKSQETDRERRNELQKVLDNIHIGVLVFDQNGEVLSMNDHAENLLDSDSNIINKETFFVQELIEIDLNTEEFDQFLQDDITTPSYHETITCLQVLSSKSPSQIPVMFSVGKISHQGAIVYLMTVINITKRKEAEQQLLLMNESLEEKVEQRTKELRTTQAALMQKNRTLAMGNMAATIVHELSQPLAAINSSIAAIQAKVSKQNWHGANESVKRLGPLSKKMTNVIGLLKSYSYEDDSLVEIVLFSTLVKQAVEVLHDRLNVDGIRIDVENNFEDAFVKVNPIKIDLAISNLLKNAIEAVEGKSHGFIKVGIKSNQFGYVTLSVEDNGGGVDKAIIDKLFSPYFTTKEVGKGMGLGLSITLEVMQEHQGQIDVKNTENGACFQIHLPIISANEVDKKLLNKVKEDEPVG